jgi:hypothetical protein
MKPKFWTVQDDGTLIQRGQYDMMQDCIMAPTKSAAQADLNKQFRAMRENRPQLRIERQGFLLVSHRGTSFVMESGSIDRPQSPHSIAHADTLAKALDDRSFKYYSSEEYAEALLVERG